MVSVIIPVYNAEETIERALESCVDFKQVLSEVILVDNNCTDQTVKKALLFKDKLPLQIIDEKTPGASCARNTGLKMAKGEYIQFLDADDELLPGKIETQLKLFENQNVGFVAGNYLVQKVDEVMKFNIDQTNSPFFNLFQGHLGITSSNLWRKSTLLKVGGWNETLKSSQEADLMYRILKSGGRCAIDLESNTIIHQDAVIRISTTNKLANAERFYALRLEIIKWVKSNKKEEWVLNGQDFARSLFFALDSVSKIDKNRAYKYTIDTPDVIWRRLSFKYKIALILKRLSWRLDKF